MRLCKNTHAQSCNAQSQGNLKKIFGLLRRVLLGCSTWHGMRRFFQKNPSFHLRLWKIQRQKMVQILLGSAVNPGLGVTSRTCIKIVFAEHWLFLKGGSAQSLCRSPQEEPRFLENPKMAVSAVKGKPSTGALAKGVKTELPVNDPNCQKRKESIGAAIECIWRYVMDPSRAQQKHSSELLEVRIWKLLCLQQGVSR